MRTAVITRTTRETDITLTLTLDGSGKTSLSTGIGFFDHMLDALCRFGQLDLALTCRGDLHVDAHHKIGRAHVLNSSHSRASRMPSSA